MYKKEGGNAQKGLAQGVAQRNYRKTHELAKYKYMIKKNINKIVTWN
jgi:hypothetical protein